MLEERSHLYSALHSHCAAKPGAMELHRRRETLFKASGRVFASMNSPSRPSVTVKAGRVERKALQTHPAVKRARWVGWLGWVTVSVHDDETLLLAAKLIDRSYEIVTT
jgi:predicted DNA-binding protein (MmcQ/YjbR family)